LREAQAVDGGRSQADRDGCLAVLVLDAERVNEVGKIALVGVGQRFNRGADDHWFVVSWFNLLGHRPPKENLRHEYFIGIIGISPRE